jgi:hypothetical protein
MRVRDRILIASVGVVATLASSLVPGSSVAHDPEIMGCEEGCVVAAGGWPLPYLVDYPAISPVGSVSLVNALIGIDRIETMPLLVSFGLWLALAAAVVVLLRSYRTGTRPPPGQLPR